MLNVAIGIVIDQGKVLICRRHNNAPLGGYWEFPGGKCEANETPLDCMCRELREEVGLIVTAMQSLPPEEHPYPTGPIRLHAFICQILHGKAAPLAAAELRWVRLAELTDFRFPPANDRLIHLLIHRNHGHSPG